MSQQELLKKVIQTLEQVGVQYMITGSVASSLQGEHRSIQDIEIIVTIKKSQVIKLINIFQHLIFI